MFLDFLGLVNCSCQWFCTVGRVFKKVELSESIRYASGDPVESWLHALLCLDATNSVPSISRLEFGNYNLPDQEPSYGFYSNQLHHFPVSGYPHQVSAISTM